MIVREYFSTRSDGVKLFKSVDVVVDANGNAVLDGKGNYIPTGLKIRKYIIGLNGKKIVFRDLYNDAIDVEKSPYKYEETDIPIEVS